MIVDLEAGHVTGTLLQKQNLEAPFLMSRENMALGSFSASPELYLEGLERWFHEEAGVVTHKKINVRTHQLQH